MKRWMRVEESVAAIAGVYAVLAPIWTETTTRATWTMVAIGLLTIAAAVVSLARPDNEMTPGALALLGALFIAAPWVMGFSELEAMAWTAWIVGAVALVIGLASWPVSHRLHREHMAASH